MCVSSALRDRSALLQPGPHREREVPVEAAAGAGGGVPRLGRGGPPAVAAEGGVASRPRPRLAVIGRLEVGELNGGQGE